MSANRQAGDYAYSSDIAFTPAVKAIQHQKGSRGNYARMERGGSWQTTVTPQLEVFDRVYNRAIAQNLLTSPKTMR